MEKKLANLRPLLIPFSILLITTLIIWAPFALNGQMGKIFANYDGPNYLIIAKCGYSPECIRTTFSQPLPLEYYPAHFPFYPFLIKIFDSFLPGWWAMLTVNLLATIGLVVIFYFLLKDLKIKGAAWLSTLILFVPARMIILRSIGAPETLFLAALLSSLYFFRKEKYFWAGIFLSLAQATKTPAILLFIAYLIVVFNREVLDKKKKDLKELKKYWPLVLGPLIILPIFLIFRQQTGNFFAYFHSGDNFHLVFPPFQTFISSRSWLGDFWLEDIIYLYFLGALAVIFLWKKYKTDILVVFPGLFFSATLFVAHRDLARYSAPLFPFWLIAFASFLNKKEFKIAFFILLPAIYLYAINFLNYNLSLIADWGPYH